MGQKIVVGPLTKGLRNDILPFNIDNDAFPTLVNAYQWRSRIKRKRGTTLMGRLTRRPIGTVANSYRLSLGNTSVGGAISGNLVSTFSLGANASIIPSTVQFVIGAATITDDGNGNLSGGGASGTIVYSTGVFSITAAPVSTATFVTFKYYPDLPVLGLEPFVENASDFPSELGFDTTYSYNIGLSYPYPIHDVSYYNNPPDKTYNTSVYTAKTNWTSLKWNLADYQQMWSTNYEGVLWAVPGTISGSSQSTVGMQFKLCATVVYGGDQYTLTITITEASASLVIGDWVFINEVITGGNPASRVNFQTGFVTASSNGAGTTTLTVKFPWANIANVVYSGGMLQYLTNNSDSSKDCIRWYNGSPVSNAFPPVFAFNQGWVNFCPPLVSNNVGTFSIGGLIPLQYYLVGARMIVPFKDRLLFFGAIVQASTGSPIYLQDTVVYSQNGTPYYTASFDASVNSPPSPLVEYHELLVPTNQTAQPTSWWENVTGLGGFLSAGYSRPITSVSINEDALIVGLADRQARLLYTGNDIIPFNFYIINSELGSDSTFSTVTLDRGVISVGGRGVILTSQISSQRIDLEIPDQVFQIKLTNQGARRISAQRDFINEWIYLTYPSDDFYTKFPSQTLLYNYREGTWAIFNESYTTYGNVRLTEGTIWSSLVLPFTWSSWNTPWSSGSSEQLQPLVIGGNQQGFIMIREGKETDEDTSLYIKSASGSTITSPDHGLTEDYIVISGCLGSYGQSVNGKVFKASYVTDNTFVIDPAVGSGTYIGGGVITRLYQPYIQTKQFPVAWDMGRKTRIGVQQYLLSTTKKSQITLLIFLSQNDSLPYNTGGIVPNASSNNSLIYSTILYTCPESTNIGLSASNENLQMVTGIDQQQIWHRMNTSLLGDTVQVGFTLSKDQMSNLLSSSQEFDITGATQANPCVLTCDANYDPGTLVKIIDVEGMTQLNFDQDDYNYYEVLSSTTTTVTLNIDSTAFDAYVDGGEVVSVSPEYQTTEIELHSMVLDVTPSQMLS